MAVITNTIRWADNTKELRANLMQGIGTLDAMKSSVDRTVASLSGQGLFQAANKVAAAIEQMGGVTKLTAAEQERANTIIDKAIEKYKTMGMVVPPALQQISDATKKSADGWQGFVKGFNVENAIADPMNTAKQAAFGLAESIGGVALAAAAATASVVAIGGAVFELASKAAAVGDELDDMADKTGMSVPALSRLQNAAGVAGTSLGQLTDAVFKIEQKMGEGGEKWDAALAKMGLSTEALKAAGPDKYLELIASGLATIEDPAERAAAGVAVMGKAFKDIAPVLADLPEALRLTNDITPWTAEQAAAAEKFEQQMESLKIHVEALSVALGRDLIPPVSAFVSVAVDAGLWVGKLTAQMAGITPMVNRIAEAWGWAAAAIDVFRGKTDLPIKLNGAEEAARKLKELKDNATDAALAPDELVKKWKASNLGTAVKSEADGFRLLETAGKDLARSATDLIKVRKEEEAESKKHKDALEKEEAAFRKFADSVNALSFKTYIADTSKLNAIVPDMTAHVQEMASKFAEARDRLSNLTSTDISFNSAVLETDAGVRKTVTAFSMLPNVVAQATKQIKEAGEEIRTAFGDRVSKVLGGVVQILHSARTAFTDFAATAVQGAKSMIDGWKNTHSVVDLVINAVATGISLIAKLFHDAEKEINPVREAFVQLNGGLAALNEKAHAAGMTLTALLDARNPEAYKKAIDDLNAAFKFQDDAMATLDATVAKYGFTIEELGPKFGQQKLSEGFLKLYQDTKVLAAAQIDLDTIIGKQADSYEELVRTALKTGQTIPKELEPILKRMAELGLLTDASGNKLEDLGQLTFAETLDQKFTSLIDTINKLADAISRGLGGAINSLPSVPDLVRTTPSFLPGDNFEPQYAAKGGRVTRFGLMPAPQYFAFGGNVLPFRPRGIDTVPAMLTPGELVLTPPAALAYEQVMSGYGAGGMESAQLTTTGTGGTGDVYQVTIVANDTRGFAQLIDKNSDAVALAFSKAVRKNRAGTYTKSRAALGLKS